MVARNYAFEMPLPHGEHKFLKVKYPATIKPLPNTFKGNTFECVFGANQSMLELFILKNKIMGPCWLNIKNVTKVATGDRKTWCKQEVVVQNPKDVSYTHVELNRESPPLVAMCFSLKTTRSKRNTNEIAMISCLVHNNIN